MVHGTADPLFPLAHGQALVEAIPNAGARWLDGAGHGLDPADLAVVASAIIQHTASVG